MYLSTSPNGITDASGNPTLLLVAAGVRPIPLLPYHAFTNCAACSHCRAVSGPPDRDLASTQRTCL